MSNPLVNRLPWVGWFESNIQFLYPSEWTITVFGILLFFDVFALSLSFRIHCKANH